MTVSWSKAWVPTTTRRLAVGDRFAGVSPTLGRRASPVRSVTGMPRSPSRASRVAACWRASRSVGASSAPCRPVAATTASAWAATAVLPEPTSPWSSRSMGVGRGEVGPDRVHRDHLIGRQLHRVAEPCSERIADRRPARSSSTIGRRHGDRPRTDPALGAARPSRPGAPAARRTRAAAGPRREPRTPPGSGPPRGPRRSAAAAPRRGSPAGGTRGRPARPCRAPARTATRRRFGRQPGGEPIDRHDPPGVEQRRAVVR